MTPKVFLEFGRRIKRPMVLLLITALLGATLAAAETIAESAKFGSSAEAAHLPSTTLLDDGGIDNIDGGGGATSQSDITAAIIGHNEFGWAWDETSLSGANSHDVCTYFDAGGDPTVGDVVAVCYKVEYENNGSLSPGFPELRIYDCDTTYDPGQQKCTGNNSLITDGSITATCSDPSVVPAYFGADPDADNQVDCQLGGPAIDDLTMLNICSKSGESASSASKDCIFGAPPAFLQLVKVLDPAAPGPVPVTGFQLTATGPETITGAGGTLVLPVPAGTYALDEAAVTGVDISDYTLTSLDCGAGDISASRSVDVSGSTVTVCTFTNSYGPQRDVTVSKLVTGDSIVTPWSFSITVDCGDGENSYALTDTAPTADVGTYPVGTECVVDEPVVPADWDLVGTYPQTKTVGLDGLAIEVTNNYNPERDVTIQKQLVGKAAPATWSFSITVDCGNGPQSYVFDQDNTAAQSLGMYPVGTQCVVDEPVVPADWDLVGTYPQTLTVDTNGLDIVVQNDYDPERDATITKLVTGNNLPAVWSFDVTVDCGNGSATYTLTDAAPTTNIGSLDVGTSCVVDEPVVPADWELVGTYPQTLTVGLDGLAIEITNNYNPQRDVVVQKAITGNDLPTTWSFDVTVDCGSGSVTYALSNTAPMATVGTYPVGTSCSLDEPTVPADWELVGSYPQTFTVGDAGLRLEITNNYNPQRAVTLTKLVTGDDVPAAWSFFVTVVCGNGAATYELSNTDPMVTVGTYPVGTDCTVHEPNVPADWEPVGTYPQTLTVGLDGLAIEVTNNYDPQRDVTVTKLVTGDNLPASWSFDITVDCDIVGPQAPTTYTLTNTNPTATVGTHPVGTECVLDEPIVPADWELVGTYPQTFTVGLDGLRLEITNNYNPQRDVTVQKQLVGNPAPATWSFSITVDCGDGSNSYVFDQDNTAAQSLGTYQVGTECVVDEPIVPADWELVGTYPQTITVGTDGLDIVVRNLYDPQRDVTVRKIVQGDDIPGDWSFDVTVDCDIIRPTASVSYTLTNVDPLATVGTFPVGTECVVDEPIVPADWQLIGSYPRTVTVGADGLAIEVVNAHAPRRNVYVEKIVVGDGPIPVGGFAIDVECGKTSGTVRLTGAEVGATLALTDVSVGVSCTVAEAFPGAQWLVDDSDTLVVGISSADNILTVTNTAQRSGLSITKRTIGGDGSFDFTGDLGDFSLTTPDFASANFDVLVPGTYTVAETAQVGWTLTSATCEGATSSLSDTALTIVVPPDAGPVSCLFVNTKDMAALTIIKKTVNGDGSFGFSSNAAVNGTFTLATVNGSASTSIDVNVPGDYTITETALPANWALTSVLCEGATFDADLGTRTVTVSVGAGATGVSCTFTNTFTDIDPNVCPANGVRFGDARLLNRDGDDSATTARTVAAGGYNVRLISMDGLHQPGFQTIQLNEQWMLQFLDASGAVVAVTPAIDDLPTASTMLSQLVATNFPVPDGVVAVRAQHVRQGYSINSIDPYCAILTKVSEPPPVDDGDELPLPDLEVTKVEGRPEDMIDGDDQGTTQDPVEDSTEQPPLDDPAPEGETAVDGSDDGSEDIAAGTGDAAVETESGADPTGDAADAGTDATDTDSTDTASTDTASTDTGLAGDEAVDGDPVGDDTVDDVTTDSVAEVAPVVAEPPAEAVTGSADAEQVVEQVATATDQATDQDQEGAVAE